VRTGPILFTALTLAVSVMLAQAQPPSITPEQYASRYRTFDGTVFVRVSVSRVAAPADFR